MAGVIELFEHYPKEIVERAVSPVFGLPSKYKFMPRIAEMKEMLEEFMAPIRREEERTSRALLLPEPPVNRNSRPTYQELVDRCARDGLTIGKKKRWAGEREIAEFKKANGISDELWNSIPNAKGV